ncbi:hypothetical protein BV455_02933 [Parageobacillus caldoxylosilyticus]|uniref:hypothetical protein n=1 Tax=Saccharococcus caldoxylosilyticus TaxID=81408 RepID=UPI001C4E2971|nr:hypothetical protein [Parageobacillus caldoxylosilyticus]QXJ39567.1 hypothetical protein BV455_02933 [Parageobacillus caldoxylosilyticus]
MKEFRVMFHFVNNNDDSIAVFLKGETEEQVLEEVYSKGKYYHFKKENVLYRVNMELVKYITVNEYNPPTPRTVKSYR